MNNLEFIEDTHTYLYKGVIIPSVSDLIRFKFPDAYKGIPKEKLKQKAEYGTKAHHTIEQFVNKEFTLEELEKKRIDPNIKLAVEQFETLRKKWMFSIESMEQIVCYKGKYAGTYDLKTFDDYIIDLKTTSELHEDWLALQLGLYYMASKIRQDFGYVIWLPKNKMAQVRQINVCTWEECQEIVKEYEKHTSR